MNQSNNEFVKKNFSKIDRALIRQNHRQVVELCSNLLDNPKSKEMENDALALTYLNRGFSRRRLRDLLGAIEDARQSSILNPRSFKPHLNAALIYVQDIQNYEKGLEEFDIALHLNPVNVEILSSRGVTKELMGDLEGAETDLQSALDIMPDDLNTLCNMGNLQLARGNVSKAAEFYQKALKVNPKDSEIRFNLAAALNRMGANIAAANVLRMDRKARALWESKGGFPLHSTGKVWKIVLVFVLVICILAVLLFLKL